jgi:hypothetical protein
MATSPLSGSFRTNNQWAKTFWRHLGLLHHHFLAKSVPLLIICWKPQKSSEFPAPHPTTGRRARAWPPLCSHAASEQTTSGQKLSGGTRSASISPFLLQLPHFSSFSTNLRAPLTKKHHAQREQTGKWGGPHAHFNHGSEGMSS